MIFEVTLTIAYVTSGGLMSTHAKNAFLGVVIKG